MSEKYASNDIRYLFFIPSFYGALTWGIWLILYLMRLINLDECSSVALALYLLVECLFIGATLTDLQDFRKVANGMGTLANMKPGGGIGEKNTRITIFLLTLHVAGLAGLVKYVFDFSKNLGGIYGFMFTLVSQAEMIRMEAETSRSIGTQLSYFGWVAIGLSVYYLVGKKISRWWWLAVFLQFAGNLFFIDRTRPFTLLFTSMLMALVAVRSLNLGKIMKWAAGAFLLATLTFWMVAEWSGKTYYKVLDEGSVLPGITQDIYLYGVSGFAYFNYMLNNRQDISYAPLRLFYPANKLLAKAGLTSEPPSPITEFYEVPFSTNVGTFLEPLYRDGGFFFVILGALLYSFGLNRLSLCFLRGGTPLAYYAWATICFTTVICFFVPKISFFGTWFFVGLGVASVLRKKIKPKISGKLAPAVGSST